MSTSETLRTGATTMYQTIRSYDRYFAQAATLDADRNRRAQETAAAPAPVQLKLTQPVTEEHHLEHPTLARRFIFKIAGDLVSVRKHLTYICTDETVMTREAARQQYRALVKEGYRKW